MDTPRHRNITIGTALALINELYFPIAIWLLFFLQYLDFTQVAIIGALTTVSANVFEIPTGAISDLIGRKWTLFWSFIFSAVGILVVVNGHTFLIFAIGRIINGLGQSLYSGTQESLMYDTLKEHGHEQNYDHVTARVETITWIGLFFAALGGGFLYDIWKTGPFLITAGLYFLAAVLCIFIQEPSIDSEKFSLKNYVSQNVKGFSELFKDKRTTQISLLIITITSGYFFAAKILGISQAKEYGMNGSGIGILFGTGYIIAAIASHFYPFLRRKFGNLKLFIVATLALLSSFLFAPLVQVYLGSALIILRISSSTTFNNARSVLINRFISSKNRATALSTLTLLSRIPFTVSFYFVGKFIDTNSPNAFALLLGVITIALLLPQVFFARNELITRRN